jgi:biotin transport system substrate-specific component
MISGKFQCFLGALIISIGAQVYIPLIPVKVTLQTLSILFVVSHFGAKLGTLSVLLYLIEGIVGIPVFAGFSAGLSIFLGPSGGYLIGFVPAAYLTGILLERSTNRTFLSVFLAGLAGEIILLVIGYLRLVHFMGFFDAYIFGILPFILGDFLKLTIFTLSVSKR